MAGPSDVEEFDELMRLDGNHEEEDSEDDSDFFPMAVDEHDSASDSRSSDSDNSEPQSDDLESDEDKDKGEMPQQDTQPPSNDTHITCSTLQLSGPIPHPVIPSYVQAMTLTKEELWHELQCMYEQNGALVQATQILTAQLDATNAHCTMAQRALAQS
ncbi:hypothetical protein F4604DRAFT_1925955 [Suillus subluteus]|nr:hypothetical protein F4604DRAFT_1925955 [Suillus subluteus]